MASKRQTDDLEIANMFTLYLDGTTLNCLMLLPQPTQASLKFAKTVLISRFSPSAIECDF